MVTTLAGTFEFCHNLPRPQWRRLLQHPSFYNGNNPITIKARRLLETQYSPVVPLQLTLLSARALAHPTTGARYL